MSARTLWLLPALVLLPLNTAAQTLPISISIDGRVGAAIPLGEFATSEDGFATETGLSYAAGATLYPTDMIGLYGAYQRSDFGCDQCGTLGLDSSATAEGFEAGLEVSVPLGETIRPWLRGGIVHQTLAFSGYGEEMSSEPATGFSGAAGVAIPLPANLVLRPGVRYFAHAADFQFPATSLPDRTIDVQAFAADVGLSFRF